MAPSPRAPRRVGISRTMVTVCTLQVYRARHSHSVAGSTAQFVRMEYYGVLRTWMHDGRCDGGRASLQSPTRLRWPIAWPHTTANSGGKGTRRAARAHPPCEHVLCLELLELPRRVSFQQIRRAAYKALVHDHIRGSSCPGATSTGHSGLLSWGLCLQWPGDLLQQMQRQRQICDGGFPKGTALTARAASRTSPDHRFFSEPWRRFKTVSVQSSGSTASP
ncbi:hypothetical protein VTN02DRAFT_1538 [Thermoascus thermophilus]